MPYFEGLGLSKNTYNKLKTMLGIINLLNLFVISDLISMLFFYS